MAIILEANYSKKLGLPGYSSHQYSVTLRTEVTDFSQVQEENSRLYALLQACVDREIQKTGYLPVNHDHNGDSNPHNNGNGSAEGWACSPRQKALILRIVEEQNLDKERVEAMARDRFGKSVKALNKLEASGLLDELLAQTGAAANGNGHRRAKNEPHWEEAR